MNRTLVVVSALGILAMPVMGDPVEEPMTVVIAEYGLTSTEVPSL